MENGLINSTLGWYVQRRVGFGVLPWSQQVRAGLNKWEPDSVWEWPTPIKATKQNHKGGKLA